MRPALVALVLALCLPVAPARAADLCEKLWVTRNMHFHRGFYCFGSALGEALFGNAACRHADPAYVLVDRDSVARMRALEDRIGCRIDSASGPTERMRAVKARLDRLEILPEPDELGWACWGYGGPAFALHAGTWPASPVIGMAEPGRSLLYQYHPSNGWRFVTVLTGEGGPVVAEGWSDAVVPDAMCAAVAG